MSPPSITGLVFFARQKEGGTSVYWVMIRGNIPAARYKHVEIFLFYRHVCILQCIRLCVRIYSQRQKPPSAGTDGGGEQNQRFARRILTQSYDIITMALCQFPLEKGLLIMAFSDAVVRAAWQRAGGRCECGRSSCGHGPWRCGKVLNWYSRGNDYASGGWEAHHKIAVSSGGADTLSNCEILCISCHKNTGSYGRR